MLDRWPTVLEISSSPLQVQRLIITFRLKIDLAASSLRVLVLVEIHQLAASLTDIKPLFIVHVVDGQAEALTELVDVLHVVRNLEVSEVALAGELSVVVLDDEIVSAKADADINGGVADESFGVVVEVDQAQDLEIVIPGKSELSVSYAAKSR